MINFTTGTKALSPVNTLSCFSLPCVLSWVSAIMVGPRSSEQSQYSKSFSYHFLLQFGTIYSSKQPEIASVQVTPSEKQKLPPSLPSFLPSFPFWKYYLRKYESIENNIINVYISTTQSCQIITFWHIGYRTQFKEQNFTSRVEVTCIMTLALTHIYLSGSQTLLLHMSITWRNLFIYLG